MSGDLVVDARGLRCPAPVIALARAAAGAPAGSVVAVWWTDPAARYDVPAWARMRGHEVLGTRPLERSPDAPEAHVTEVRLGTRASGA